MLVKELGKHLQSGKLDPVYLVHGEERYFSDEAVRLLIDRVVAVEDRSFLLGQFDLEEGEGALSAALSHARTVPFFGKTQAVVLRIGSKLSPEETDRLAAYARNPSPDTVFVLKLDELDPAKKGFSEIRECCTEIRCDALKGRDLVQWIVARSKSEGAAFSEGAARQLVDWVGSDLRRLESEILKVGLYYPGKDKILPEDVCEVVGEIPMETVFRLMDAIGRKETARAETLLGRLLFGGSEPLSLLGMIARQFRILWKVKYFRDTGTPASEIPSAADVHSGLLNEYLRQARLFSSRELRESLLVVQRADLTLKSTDLPERTVLEKLIFDLTVRKPAPPVLTASP